MKTAYVKIIILLIVIFILAGISVSSAAAALDFGWGTPVLLANKGKSVRESYVAWPIQISNNTRHRLTPQIDIVVVTDTGKQYSPVSGVQVKNQDSREMVSLADIKGNIFPSVTRRALAVFKDIDPKATVIHFYIGGLEDGENRVREKSSYLKVTYKRLHKGWKLEGTDVME